MPPSRLNDAIIIVLDVGKSVSTLNYWENTTFFEQARNCVSWIIQRKLISESKDVLSLLLIGSDGSNNRVSISGYNNISCKFDLQLPSWDMLKFIETEVQPTENESDWIGALIVAMEMLKTYEEFNKVENRKIVFFSDFTCPASDDIDIIVKNIKALDIEITIIGPENVSFFIENEEENEDDDELESVPPLKKKMKLENSTRERQEGEKLVCELWRKLPQNIGVCTFKSALKQLCSYTRKSCRTTPWNCIMDIGEVKINISMLKKTDPKSTKRFNMKCVKSNESQSTPSTSSQNDESLVDKIVPAVRDKTMHYKHGTPDCGRFLDIEVKAEDTVEGYRYGTTITPFSETDKAVMKYNSGPKSFSVIGFTNISSVPYYLLSGECSYLVLPKDKDENAEVALSAIIQAMKKLKYLAIVRRVYSDNRGLSIGILYPIIEEIVCDETDEVSYMECLLFVELAFKEEVKPVHFPSLKSFASKISPKQYELIDNLIDDMNLMKADKGLRGEPCEAFDLSSLHDFKEQFFHHCVIQKGLHSDQPLPSSPPPFINEFIQRPKSLEEKCEKVIAEIKKEFLVEFIKEKLNNKEEENNSSIPGENLDVDGPREHFTEAIMEEETDIVKRQWMKIFKKGFPDYDEVISNIPEIKTSCKVDDPDILKSLQIVISDVRGQYLKINPDAFNNWVMSFKNDTKGKKDIEAKMWEIIVSENLGLINKKENKYSKVSEEESEGFLCDDVTKSISCKTPDEDKTDFVDIQHLQAEQEAIGSIF